MVEKACSLHRGRRIFGYGPMEKMSQGLLLKHAILHNVWEIPFELQARSSGSAICLNPTILISINKTANMPSAERG